MPFLDIRTFIMRQKSRAIAERRSGARGSKQLISVKDILFRYRKDAERPALDGVSLEVYEGEWLCYRRPQRFRKSTLARALNGLILPEAGEIEVGGIKLTEDTVWDVRKK